MKLEPIALMLVATLWGANSALAQGSLAQIHPGALPTQRLSSPPHATSIATPLGIILLHGKKGSPQYLHGIKTTLQDHGYLVSTPEMCWSDRRMYDRNYHDCLAEIDAAVADLRQRGAKAIVVAGHSLGGGAAIAYGAGRDDLAGVIGIAAGDAFWGSAERLPDIARARQLVELGQGDTVGEFADISTTGGKSMRTTATHFLSFVWRPREQMMPAHAARLHAPLLLVAGTRDAVSLQYEARTFANVPTRARNRFVEVEADHNGTIPAGTASVLDWLANLTRDP